MRRASDKKHPLTVSDSGDVPSTIERSSVATASMAGMAAILWSRYPWWSGAMLLSELQQHSSYFPTRHARWGWGLFSRRRLSIDRYPGAGVGSNEKLCKEAAL
jgi:hypothetical protein